MTPSPLGDDELLGALAEARALGFLGPGPVEDQLVSGLAFVGAVLAHGPASGAGIDIGSGGGVPGLVLAARLPAWRWTLLDASRRRTSFLSAVIARLGLADHCDVVRGRSEEVGHQAAYRRRFAVVTARSFGSPAATVEAAAPLLDVGGFLFVAEPPDDEVERWPAEGLRSVGLQDEGITGGERRIRRLQAMSACPPAYPRRWRVQQREPLF